MSNVLVSQNNNYLILIQKEIILSNSVRSIHSDFPEISSLRLVDYHKTKSIEKHSILTTVE